MIYTEAELDKLIAEKVLKWDGDFYPNLWVDPAKQRVIHKDAFHPSRKEYLHQAFDTADEFCLNSWEWRISRTFSGMYTVGISQYFPSEKNFGAEDMNPALAICLALLEAEAAEHLTN